MLDNDPDDAQLVAWTTTPWTLPSNLALCVNPEFEYVKVLTLSSSPPPWPAAHLQIAERKSWRQRVSAHISRTCKARESEA